MKHLERNTAADEDSIKEYVLVVYSAYWLKIFITAKHSIADLLAMECFPEHSLRKMLGVYMQSAGTILASHYFFQTSSTLLMLVYSAGGSAGLN